MADILIPNMELPREERCIELAIFPDGRIEQKHLAYGLLHLKQKAIELPPHGRLGDLDAFKNSVADMRMEKTLRNGARQVIEIGELFGQIIDDEPTIVEASK